MTKRLALWFTLLAVAATAMQAEAFRQVQKAVRERTGADVRWEKELASRAETSAIVRGLLKNPLTVASAVHIALLNNRGLQVTFEEVG